VQETETATSTHVHTVYDGFISYSHAADGLLAPRLQSGLQRFAKPWWKRRALRIFRDESSLTANPHLWSSITDALDSSGWFVLLLSPDAARSPWVTQEIEYWVEQKDPSRILPVLTDGELGWNGDITGDAAPDALRGVFSAEPRWVDIRFAKNETQLDLKNPQFSAAVADIAAAIRGVPKDELESEEVQQHRRTIRTAWAAAILVLLLGVAAVIAAVAATNNAQIARTREMSASALNALESDPELAILLSIEALEDQDQDDVPHEAVDVLRAAVMSDSVIRRMDIFERPEGDAQGIGRISDDGRWIVTAAETVSLLDYETGEVLWTFDDPSVEDKFLTADISPDSSIIVVAAHDHGHVADGEHQEEAADGSDEVGGDHGAEADAPGEDSDHHENPDSEGESTSSLIVLDASDGSPIHTFETGPCEDFRLNLHQPAFSPDGGYLAALNGTSQCLSGGEENWLELWDTETWEPQHRIEVGTHEQIDFAESGERALLSSVDRVAILDFDTMEVLEKYDYGIGGISPDGSLAAMAEWQAAAGTIDIIELDSGETIQSLSGWDGPLGKSLYFSDDGRQILAETVEGEIPVWDVSTGHLVGTQRAVGFSAGLSFHPSMTRFISNQIEMVEYELPDRRLALAEEGSAPIRFGANARLSPEQHEWFTASDGIGIAVGATQDDRQMLIAFDTASGEALDIISGEWAVGAADGRFAVVSDDDPSGEASTSLALWDPRSKNVIDLPVCGQGDRAACAGNLLPLSVAASATSIEVGVATSDGRYITSQAGEISHLDLPAESNRVLALTDDWVVVERLGVTEWYAVERGSGEITELGLVDLNPSTAAVLPDGDLLVATLFGRVSVYDPETWTPSASFDSGNSIRAMAVSEDGSRIALLGDDGLIQIYDVASGAQLQRLTIADVAGMVWMDEKTLGVLTINGAWSHQPLDLADLLTVARQQLSRSLTDQECSTYRIAPCPTLEEVREG
jgi:WD40 repeat protein